uniref:Uncharacterized protein n=1 Tax=Lactuca sativa TaxID=4236 RepID=A0A9R1XQG2_LACSA|nr:hypothetical protein LSAT_V11C300150400 [Lactuca sativa]
MLLWQQFCVAHIMESTQSRPMLHACPLPDSKCRFLGWFDLPMCDRAKAIIPGLLKSMNNLKLSAFVYYNGQFMNLVPRIIMYGILSYLIVVIMETVMVIR